jgi:hypothetical protein
MAKLTVSDRQLSKEIDRMDGVELWRACFSGGMEVFVGNRSLEVPIRSN